MRKALIVAMARNRVIGRNNKLPWYLPGDLRYFKQATMGKPIIMGRKTWDSIGKPLPGRQNIIITRNKTLKVEGCFVVHSLSEAIELARSEGDSCPMIIGGSLIYAEALPLTTIIHLTHVNIPIEDADTFFPEIDSEEWRETERTKGKHPDIEFVRLERIQHQSS